MYLLTAFDPRLPVTEVRSSSLTVDTVDTVDKGRCSKAESLPFAKGLEKIFIGPGLVGDSKA